MHCLSNGTAIGCAFALIGVAAAAATTNPTYTKDIAPILNENCVVCHRPGDIGPMSLMRYREVRPWAKSIQKNVQEGVMPPWHADPGFGPFRNERSLNQDEIDTIVSWVENGTPRGNPDDLPPLPTFGEDGWKLGEPDLVLELEPVTVPADGPDQFHDLIAETNLDEDKWIEAVEILPGERSVVHHVILWQGGASGNQEGWIGAWAAGAQPMVFPAGTGRLLKKGQKVIGDMHYHPAGKAATDRTQIGFHFAEGNTVEKELINLWVMNAEFAIPPGDPNYEAHASHTFAQDSQILTLTPHLHYRGKDFRYTLTYPDGHKTDLLTVSNYDFNWQTVYEFEEPVPAPAGARIDCVAHWDNSADNPNNPDPNRTVYFGPESYDEMMIGFVDYVVDEGVRPVEQTDPVITKMQELARTFPGEVFKVMIRQGGQGFEPSALHLPPQGQGGWYVRVGSIAGKAPITDIVWSGKDFTAIARIPGQDPAQLAGTVTESGLRMTMDMGNGMTAPLQGDRVD